MSKMTPKSNIFIQEIKRVVEDYPQVRGGWNDTVKVYYDGDKYSKRDYVINASVRDNWDKEDSEILKSQLREIGATNIIGCVRHAIARDYIDWSFDIKKSKLKELGLDKQ